ncbi:MAG: eukaryotic-like serine/threonine-protein kinase [Verrucomicrobiota bacterium]|jgi:TolB-like protein/Tfp pilus assembly protein PilF
MIPKNFFGELRRRNVYKVAVAYAVVAWLLIQAASILFPTFDAPPWVMKVFVVVILFGFPVALIFSWAFEITPEGIKREKDVTPQESIAPQTGRKLVVLTIVVALIAAALFAYQVLRTRSTIPAVSGSTTTRNVVAAPGLAPDKSIAVLPFDNLSDEKSNAYFAEGIQDEILTRLSKIAALKVISRSSTQKYKSAPDNLREVGKQLGVANLLEGSVQKIANSVHVNVQLIRAATDEHLWAESYNRKLDDVFGVEGEVATAIADQLNAKLSGTEQKAITDKPTQNAAAYDAYLRGLTLEHDEYSYDAYLQVARDYAEAVRLDPKFALAWARLAVMRSFLYFNTIEAETNTPAAVKDAADRAVALAPEAAESWVAQGAYRYRVSRNFESALAAYQEAQKRLPNSALAYQYMAIVQRRLGRWQEAETNYKKALELDPRDVRLLSSMGAEFYNYLRRWNDAYAVLNRALEIAPDAQSGRANKASVLQNEGRLQDAAKELALIPGDATDDWVVGNRIQQALLERRYDDAIKIIERKLNSLPSGQPLDFFGKFFLVVSGFCHEWSGRPDEARRAFTRALQTIKPTPDAEVVPDANGTPTVLALAYAGLREKEKALQQAQKSVKDYATDAVAKPQSEITLAQIQARFGDSDSAIAAIPHLLEVPAGLTIANLKLDPFWDPLRKDPRFAKIIAESKPR